MFTLGIWKNIDELEDTLSLVELDALLVAMRKLRTENYRMAAAMQGVEWPEDEAQEDVPTVDDIRRRALAKAGVPGMEAREITGVDEDLFGYEEIG